MKKTRRARITKRLNRPRMAHVNKYDPIKVLWADAAMTGDWISHEDAEKIPVKRTVSAGFFVNENDHTLRLVMSKNDEHLSETLAIPKACIIWVRRMR